MAQFSNISRKRDTPVTNAVDEVNLAYDGIKEIDCLDVSPEGTTSWEAANRRYDERIERPETRITSKLRDQLGTAKNANEIFRIFSRLNALFVRQHIRGAITEYQNKLIQRVKHDIEQLQNKFKVRYIAHKTFMAFGLITSHENWWSRIASPAQKCSPKFILRKEF